MRRSLLALLVFVTLPLLAETDFLIQPSAAPTGNLHLLAKTGTLTPPPVTLTPSNPAVAQVLETPVLVSVTIPKDPTRTYFFVNGSVLHDWNQIASASPYLFSGSLRYSISSPSLPSTCSVPGQIQFGLGHDSVFESAPSSQTIGRIQDRVFGFVISQELLAELIVNRCGATPPQAATIANDLVKDTSTWEVTSRIRVRSVDEYNITNAFLALFGD